MRNDINGDDKKKINSYFSMKSKKFVGEIFSEKIQ